MSGSKEEMICKNCKYHYIEDISFDYPQSCCSKRQCTTEQWCKCYGFEYSDRYIEQLQQENQKLESQQKEFIEYLINLSNWYDADGVKQGIVNGILIKYKEILKEVE